VRPPPPILDFWAGTGVVVAVEPAAGGAVPSTRPGEEKFADGLPQRLPIFYFYF